MLRLEVIQPIAKKMQYQEKVAGNQNCIHGQLNGERS